MVEPLKHISNDELEKKNGVKNEIDNVRVALSKHNISNDELEKKNGVKNE